MQNECDCGAEATGKWAHQHTEGCASLKPSPMTRQQIIDLICDRFEPCPHDWPRHRPWNDHAEEIADEILESFGCPVSPDNPNMALAECPLCKLKASTGLHRFCTRGPGECPVR